MCWRSLGIRGGLGANDKDKWLVRALAWTSFARVGEVKESLETFGLSGGKQESVKVRFFLFALMSASHLLIKHSVASIVQVFLYQ